jgi:type IV secretory pathway VirB2 component (pilin)
VSTEKTLPPARNGGAHRSRSRLATHLTSGEISKVLVAILTAVASGLPIYFGTAKWEPVAVWAVGIVVMYLVPNTPPPS